MNYNRSFQKIFDTNFYNKNSYDYNYNNKKICDSINIIKQLIKLYNDDNEIIGVFICDNLRKILSSFDKIKNYSTLFIDRSPNDVEIFKNKLVEINRHIKNLKNSKNDKDILKKDILSINNYIQLHLGVLSFPENETNLLNPSEVYALSIKRLEEEKRKLEDESKLLKEKIDNGSIEEIKTLRKKELELEKNTTEINQTKTEKEKSLQQEEIIEAWNRKISNSFEALHKSITPIKREYGVLWWLFGIYSFSILVMLGGLIYYTFDTSRYQELTKDSLWIHYVAAMMPIPLLIGLLWGFIVQLNRVQRQKLIVAKHIHSITYVEKLLLTINTLSMDPDDSLKRVNSCIDKLLENCLHNNKEGSYSEESLIKEEAKDVMPLEHVLKIMEKTKSLISK